MNENIDSENVPPEPASTHSESKEKSTDSSSTSAVIEPSDSSPTADDDQQPLLDFRKFSIQDYLSLGYLYLLSMGIITEVVYYKLFGVNILMYSGLVDILLSPLVFVSKRLAILVALIVAFVIVALIDRTQRKKQEEKDKAGKQDDSKRHPQNFVIKIYAMMVFFMFIGGGIGAGTAQSLKIKSGDFTCTNVIEFMDGQTVDVRIIGQNNEFVFFAVQGETKITVSPIKGNIKRISPYKKRANDEDTATDKTEKQQPEKKDEPVVQD